MIKNIGKIICTIFVIFILVYGCDMIGIIGSKETIQMTISENDNLTTVSEELKENNVILSQHIFKLYYKLTHSDLMIHPGIFSIQRNSSYKDIAKAITSPQSDTLTITIPEGFEVREIAARLFEKGLISNIEDFEDSLKTHIFRTRQGTVISGETMLEGYLFPDTYQIESTAKPKDIIALFTGNFKSKWTDEYDKRAKELGMNVKEVITLASIVEREARKTEDFPLVASVFHNRLNSGKRLESCATVQYILKERKPVLSVADTKIDSPYNTYQNAGLPPAPISSPGILAIESVLYPEDTDYLYFFTDKNGDNHYAKTFEEHNRLIQQYGL